MKKINVFALLAAFLVITVSSCKKEEDDNNNNNNPSNPLSQAIGGSATIPTDADGAFYAVNNYVISDDGFGELDTMELGTAYAWFESYTTTKDGGGVRVNTGDLQNEFAGVALPWYYTLGTYIDFTTGGNTADWEVDGNSSTGIAGFTHTDNTAFPKCNFTVPATISRSSSYTVNFTNQGSNDGVFVTLYAQGNLKITKGLNANSTSATFTAAEIQSISSPGSLLGVQVMPVKLTAVTLTGKKYYFVKQWAFAQFSEAM